MGKGVNRLNNKYSICKKNFLPKTLATAMWLNCGCIVYPTLKYSYLAVSPCGCPSGVVWIRLFLSMWWLYVSISGCEYMRLWVPSPSLYSGRKTFLSAYRSIFLSRRQSLASPGVLSIKIIYKHAIPLHLRMFLFCLLIYHPCLTLSY